MKMVGFYFVLGIFSFVAVAAATTTTISAEEKSWIPELINGPEQELNFSDHDKGSSFMMPTSQSSIKGRLLTPEEGCGISKVDNKRIVGGSPAKIGAWPWMALLGYGSGYRASFNCGGSLITSRHVLSAAHCVKFDLFVVRLGEHDLGGASHYAGTPEDIRVAYAEPHAAYDKLLAVNDVAIVYLRNDVDFTDRIKPICLPFSSSLKYKSFVGDNPFVAGWGLTKEDGNPSDVLMQVQVPVITNAECLRKYKIIDPYVAGIQFSDRVLCAGFAQGGKDSCQGDSGGPLMLPVHENGKFPYYQIGVVSYGFGCGRVGFPGVYANVQYYQQWIEGKISR